MNERIRELAKQSLPEFYLTNCPSALEKFAESIVTECAHVAVFKDSGTVATANVAGYMAAGRSIAASLIKEHFGVEE